jgi:hypothetical protein
MTLSAGPTAEGLVAVAYRPRAVETVSFHDLRQHTPQKVEKSKSSSSFRRPLGSP